MATLTAELLDPASSTTTPSLRPVLVAPLLNPKHASSAMKSVSASLPLSLFSLEHCKRIRKDRATRALQLLLAPADHWESVPAATRQAWVEGFGFGPVVAAEVPATPPQSKAEFEAVSQVRTRSPPLGPRLPLNSASRPPARASARPLTSTPPLPSRPSVHPLPALRPCPAVARPSVHPWLPPPTTTV